MQSLVIDAETFIKGISLTDEHQDGGYSPIYGGQNIAAVGGKYMVPMPEPTILGDGVIKDSYNGIIAACHDPGFAGNDAYMVDDDGNFYMLAPSGTVTNPQTDSVNSYTYGTTAMIFFKGYIYATSTTDIAKLATNMTSLDATWWTGTMAKTGLQSSYRHPMEIVEDTLYMGDKDMIHTYDGSTATYNAMTLPGNCNITTMRKHPDGRHLIVFVGTTANYSHSRYSPGKAYIIDTVTMEFIQEIELGVQVEGSINIENIIYVTYGNNLGYFDGNGVKFLRTISPDGHPIYNHRLANNDGTLLLVESDLKILAYGEVRPGYKTFYYPLQLRDINFHRFGFLQPIGDNRVLTCYYEESGTTDYTRLIKVDFNNYDKNSKVKTNRYQFPDDVWVRKVKLVIDNPTNHYGRINILLYKETGEHVVIGTLEYTTDGEMAEKTFMTNFKLNQMQLLLEFTELSAGNNSRGIKKIIVYYEPDDY